MAKHSNNEALAMEEHVNTDTCLSWRQNQNGTNFRHY